MNSKSYTILLKTALVVFSCLFMGSLYAQDENILIVTTANDIADAPDTTSIAALKGNKGADGLISLREAISACNGTTGLDTIKFAIGTGLQTINIATTDGLPRIFDPLYLDATTQPGYSGDPIIELDGSGTSEDNINGLYVRTNNSTVKGFIVHSFVDEGLEIDGSTGYGDNNVFENNWVGITSTGAAAGNGDEGILISVDADGNTVRNNIISSNSGDGLEIHTNSDNNWVWGNIFGLGIDGATVRSNSGQGLRIGGSGNIIGTNSDDDNDENERNVISGNFHGIYVTSNSLSDIIAGNYIGLDVTGTQDKGNTGDGIYAQSVTNLNIVGNVISANNYGINFDNSTLSNVYGNYIGTNAAGMNDFGNSIDGVVIQNGSQNITVGGSTASLCNIISGNDNDGIWITGSSTFENTVQGNWIGLDANEGALGNSYHGIGVEGSSYNNLIGGTSVNMGNNISNNAWDGVSIVGGTGNAIIGNELTGNGHLAIDLQGGTENGFSVTANELDDGDTGSNNLQNFPELSSALTNEVDELIIYSSLNSTPSTSYRVEFFYSNTADPSGYGEGEMFLGDTTVITNSSGDVSFNKTFTGVAVLSGKAISATATDPLNNTSEFSGNVVAQCPIGSIGNFVWNDINGDGIQDSGESGLQNVLVILYDSSDTQVDNTSTDVSGNYTFTNVTPGDYYVKFIPPANYVFSPQDATSDALDSDADIVTGKTFLTTISSGENDLTWDAGMYYPATIGDFVWLDADENGIQDGGEVGIENITINIRYDGGGLAQSTSTNGAGLYSFANIISGNYYLEFILPAEYLFSAQDQGGDNSTDSDANTSTGLTAVTTLSAGENDPSWDAGMYLLPTTASIGDYIWHDLDYNGVQDAGEPGFDNVTVGLYLDDGDGVIDGGDTHIGQETTSGGGYYTFTGLVPGDYLVTVTDDNSILDGYLLSAGSDPQEVTLIADQIFNDANFGYYLALTYYDYGDLPAPYQTLIIDDGARHIYDGVTFLGNPGSTNSDFELNGQPNASATGDDINGTDDDDGVTFLTPFIPGESARITISAGVAGYLNSWIDFNNDGDFNDGGEHIADEFYLNAGSNQIEIPEVSYNAVGTINSRFRFTVNLDEANTPFGTAPNGEVEDYKLNSIQCFVWEDLYNGKQNEGEEGLNNAVVFLFDDVMNPIAGVETKNHPITDEPGWCEFPGVPQGNYYLEFNLLGGYSFTIKDAGDDDSIDSDADETTGFSDMINITSSGEYFRVDAGMKENTQIDFGDLPEVYQTYTANDGPGHVVDSEIYLGPSVPDSETNGQPNSTATGDDIDGNNDDDGITFLHPLHPGYQVDISIEASEQDKFLNAWIDFNNNSTFSDPGEHIAIDIELDKGNTIYSIPAIPSTATGPMYSRFRFSSDTGLQWYGPASDGEVEDYALGIIGNFIWVDINGDGVQNDGDYSGLNDVQVNLLDGSGNPVLDKLGNPIFTITKNSLQNGYPGYYEFPGIPPGDYMIEVIALPGYDFTTKDNSGDDQTDSDVDAVTGRSDIISITFGLNNDFSDAGFNIDNPTSIGDYIWNDFDGDGIQDGSEVGIGQITIELYRDINHDNILDAGDVLIRQQTTETDGSYEFMGLVADDYLVMVTDDNGILGYYSISGGTNPHNIELSAGQDYNEADFGYKTFDFDFGDLPLPYPTTVSNDGPRHPSIETGDVQMGLRMDTEIDGQEHDNAYADDSDKGPTLDDEDGVSFVTPLHPGRNAQVNISMPVINSSGYLNAWIDFNTDGDFDDTDERIATDFFIEYGNANSLLFSVPEDASGVEYSRFRLTLNSEEVTSYTGTAPNGEVEDYALGTISGYVFNDIYGDGLQDLTDPIIPGVLVKLLDAVGSPILDADNNPITILTDINGFYEFPGLFPNYYILEFVKQGGTVFTIPNRVHESLYNSKANVISGRTSTMIIENGSVFNDIYVGIFNDADNDHVPDLLEGNGDNDTDGLINSNDYDPAGYIYDGTSGEILSGGLIEVTGPGYIAIIEDGSSGYYEFYTDGTEGVYTIALTPPSGYEISSTCISLDPPAFDPTGEPNPIYLGSSESGSTGYLSDFDCVDNPYYFTFNLESGDPFIINNNFPLEQVTTGIIGDYVLNDINHDGLQDAGDVGIENVKLTLFDGTATKIAETYTDANGWYAFTGLLPDDYTIIVDENTLPRQYPTCPMNTMGLSSLTLTSIISVKVNINLDLDFGYKDTPLPVTLLLWS